MYLSAITIVVDPATGTAISLIISAMVAGIVTLLRFWIREVRGKVDTNIKAVEAVKSNVKEVEAKTDDAARLAALAADKTVEAHGKLDAIKSTTEQAAKDVDGNLHAVRDELGKSLELNRTQSESIQSLKDTIATLTEIISRQRTQSRSTDVPPRTDSIETVARVIDAALHATPAPESRPETKP